MQHYLLYLSAKGAKQLAGVFTSLDDCQHKLDIIVDVLRNWNKSHPGLARTHSLSVYEIADSEFIESLKEHLVSTIVVRPE